jgi:YjbE family integral membrane protein
MDQLASPLFWVALGNIIIVNIVLSGDNAVVIALAARSLPPRQQRLAIFYGSAAAIVLRVILTIFALQLLSLPYLKLVGAILLFYIGMQLLADEEEEGEVKIHSGLAGAIKTILLADLVMSLDNVLGVAAAAKGNITLLVLGLAISIPLIIFGSTLILKHCSGISRAICCSRTLALSHGLQPTCLTMKSRFPDWLRPSAFPA